MKQQEKCRTTLVPFRGIWLFLFIFFFGALHAYAQQKIELKHADVFEFDKQLGNDAKRLVGHVSFRQGKVLMFCDSAYFYSNNAFDAFGDIHIKQGDSIDVYGDLLKYQGDTKQAVLTGKIRMVQKNMLLTTDQLFYDLNTSSAHYITGGKIVSNDDTLTSKNGYYYAKTSELLFSKNVVMTNPEYVMRCDTLRYNKLSRIAYFLGPTTMTGKNDRMYCESGWYNTQSDLAMFSKNARIDSKERSITGDTVYYNKGTGKGKVIDHVAIVDTSQNIIVKGDYAEYSQKTGGSLVTGHAILEELYKKDTLFVHADTLRSIGNGTKKGKNDRPRKLYAYHHVKFFKRDMQGKCDSLVYTDNDSTMRLFKSPVLWSNKNQLTADSIQFTLSHGEIKTLSLVNNAFIASQEDTSRFNQIRGKNMKGYFRNNKLFKITVDGNGQTVYYAKDKKKLVGVNKTDCSDIIIFLKNDEIDQITFITMPDATMFPMDQVTPQEMLLKNFSWKGDERPLNKMGIFN